MSQYHPLVTQRQHQVARYAYTQVCPEGDRVVARAAAIPRLRSIHKWVIAALGLTLLVLHLRLAAHPHSPLELTRRRSPEPATSRLLEPPPLLKVPIPSDTNGERELEEGEQALEVDTTMHKGKKARKNKRFQGARQCHCESDNRVGQACDDVAVEPAAATCAALSGRMVQCPHLR